MILTLRHSLVRTVALLFPWFTRLMGVSISFLPSCIYPQPLWLFGCSFIPGLYYYYGSIYACHYAVIHIETL
jgi:hypothetical protein